MNRQKQEAIEHKTILLDFDATIHSYEKGWQDGVIYGTPNDYFVEGMKLLTDNGFNIVIFTARLNPDCVPDAEIERKKIVAWLNKWGINKRTHYQSMDYKKIGCLIQIDDKGERYKNNLREIVAKLLI